MKNIAKDKNEKELGDLLKDRRKALADFSADAFQGKVKNIKSGGKIRKEIAQILTAQSITAMKSKEIKK